MRLTKRIAIILLPLIVIGWWSLAFWNRKQTGIIWQVPKGETGVKVELLANGQIAVVTWATTEGGSSRHTVRVLDKKGRSIERLDLDTRWRIADPTGLSRRMVWAFNCMTKKGVWTPVLVNLETKRISTLPEGYAFPWAVYGDSTPICPSGDHVLAVPSSRRKDRTAWIVDATSGELVHAIRKLPTYHGELIRWADCSGIKWWDVRAAVLRREDGKPASQSFSNLIGDQVVLSPDALSLAVVDNAEAGMLQLALYSISSAVQLASFRQDISPHDGIESMRWSPDGNKLAVSTYDDDSDGNALYLLKKDGTIRPISVPGYRIIGVNSGFSWSPDSKRLAIAVYPASKDIERAALAIINI